ncbi:hypothetical protein ACIQV2_13520 [Streptomyces globosus]|uniref:hypothetical protein n=1 Tax=Streptomyces TaxID=1883 RepID=UPI000F73A90D|nr:hypothetical protein [Streptomyces sp. WAC05292]RSS82792.1 hypothetical protein EF903_26720 [Streptomyces sp. WAC05292]
MVLRRAALPLPLTLAALVLATGCVTVRPEGPAPSEPPAPAAGREASAALPLSALPAGGRTIAESPPAPAVSSAPAAAPAPRRQRSEADRAPREARKPPRAAAPPAPAKRRKAPARRASRHPYDMASLCEAAKGTVSPSIVALCG